MKHYISTPHWDLPRNAPKKEEQLIYCIALSSFSQHSLAQPTIPQPLRDGPFSFYCHLFSAHMDTEDNLPTGTEASDKICDRL